jgi:hypothetical protein
MIAERLKVVCVQRVDEGHIVEAASGVPLDPQPKDPKFGDHQKSVRPFKGIFSRDISEKRAPAAVTAEKTAPPRGIVSAPSCAAAGLPCASGNELVSLGVRVDKPSAIGWHQPRIF